MSVYAALENRKDSEDTKHESPSILPGWNETFPHTQHIYVGFLLPDFELQPLS